MIWAVIYGAGMLLAWRPLFRYWYWINESCRPSPDWADIGFSIFMAFTVCWLWPLLVCFKLLQLATNGHDPRRFAQVVGGESRAEKRARKQRNLEQARANVRRLERELGIE